MQGEQVAQLWPILFRMGVEIVFAHRTFAWGSDARGKAHVHVVIIGLTHRNDAPREKRLFSYASVGGEPDETRHAALTAYLFDAGSVANRHLVVREEARPINGARRLLTGSKPLDGNITVFDSNERAALIAREPRAASLLHEYVGGAEFINGFTRWVLVTADVDPGLLRTMPAVMELLARVRTHRESSDSATTRSIAATPSRWHVTVIPDADFLVLPNVSSERREYVPFGWVKAGVVPNQKLRVLQHASLGTFGILTSRMHMGWMRAITGRMKSDYMYSVGVVYNTFPWPDTTPAQRDRVEALAQAVLDARAAWPTSSLADLYDPDTMPANLRRAHQALDVAVDRLYRREPFASDRDRVEHLFGRYEALVDPLGRDGAKQNRRMGRKGKPRG